MLEATATGRSLVDLLHCTPAYLPQSPTTCSSVHPALPRVAIRPLDPLLLFPSSLKAMESTICTFFTLRCNQVLPLGTEHGDRNMECDFLLARVSIYITEHSLRVSYSYDDVTDDFTDGCGNDIVRPSLYHASRIEYRCWKCGFAWESDKPRTSSSKESKRFVCDIGKTWDHLL